MDLQLRSTDIAKTRYSLDNLAKLKEQFPTKDNDTLARYLVANDNDASKAVEQLKKAEQLSSEYANISMNQCLKEIAKGTAYVHGFDRDGRPLIIVNARLHDPVNRDVKEAVLMTLWWTEQAIARLPPEHSRFTILLDRSNCENDVDTEYMKLLSTIFLDLHPERLHRAIVYPAGIVFYSMWNLLLKWFMAETTRNKVLPAVNFEDVTEFIDPMYIPEDLGGECTYKFNINDFDDLHLEGGAKSAKKVQSTPEHLTAEVPIKGRAGSDQRRDVDNAPGLNVLYVNQMSESYGSDQFGPGLGPDVLKSMSADTTVESRDGSAYHRTGPQARRGISEVRTPLGTEPKENPDLTPLSEAVAAAKGVVRPPLHSPTKHDATPATPFPYLAPETPVASGSTPTSAAHEAAPETPEASAPKLAPLSAAATGTIDRLVEKNEHSPMVPEDLAAGSISPLSGDSGHDHHGSGKGGEGSPQLSPKVGVFTSGLAAVPEAGPAPVVPSSRPSTAVGSRPPSATASVTASAAEGGAGTGAATDEPLDSIDALGTEGEDVWHEVASVSDEEPVLREEGETVAPQPPIKMGVADGDDVSLDSCAERLVHEPFTPSVLPSEKLPEPLSEESYHYNAAKRAAAGIVSPPSDTIKRGGDSLNRDRDAVSYISGSRSVSASALAGTNISSFPPSRKPSTAEVFRPVTNVSSSSVPRKLGAPEESKPVVDAKKGASVVSGPYSVDTSSPSPALGSDSSTENRRGPSAVSGPYSVETSLPSPFPFVTSVASDSNCDAVSPVRHEKAAKLIEGPPVMPLLESQEQVASHVPVQVSGSDKCEVDVDFETEEDGVEGAEDGSCWEEVASEHGEALGWHAPIAPDPAPRSTAGTGVARRGSRTTPVVEGTFVITTASTTDTPLVAAPSTGVRSTTRVSKAQVASYVQSVLSLLWCLAVAAAAGVGLYSAYYPFKVQVDVPATLLAQIALMVLLGVCFL